MANRRIDPRRIKTHFSYTVEEAADALGVHKNTVRMWIKGGLAVADNRRPTVMSGAAIRDYLENRVSNAPRFSIRRTTLTADVVARGVLDTAGRSYGGASTRYRGARLTQPSWFQPRGG
jgi:Helix-turn-helix domain